MDSAIGTRKFSEADLLSVQHYGSGPTNIGFIVRGRTPQMCRSTFVSDQDLQTTI
ncbi:hypothetical protein JI435_410990 [Parastagonospora nodorum SN15]|uniref:Uncharacterized protein n=1 Tax=Phaeosphaeria nodorum (strain SN15 / ATCC MYA-4574 / FGSC 10173) TaxID=321614 RepID=A0A7U2I0X0_PHANO|nr:hypothetical protein JI435_410990 [Parastagonospora nodorum SN15]